MEQPQNKTEFSIKQKILLYLYKSEKYINVIWFLTKQKIKKFWRLVPVYLLLISITIFILHKISIHFNLNISEDHLYNLGFAIAAIIGASIAIIFSFSTFILQSTADLFSTQYLNKFVKSTKERIFFWLLVILTLISFLVPIIFKTGVLEILTGVLLIAFYLIYYLYLDLRKRINPETTLKKIKEDAIKELERKSKKFRRHANIQSKIFAYKKENKDLSLDIQYKLNTNWHSVVLENTKYLFEIGLRLLSKNEINSFNLTLKYIHDIYIKHLDLRNGYLIRTPASLFGSYTVDDEGFTTSILEYLQSISDRLIQEKRKENIYFLIKIYESIINNALRIKYADESFSSVKGNPLLDLILAYHTGFIEKLLKSKETDWIWESIKSVSNLSNTILQYTDNYFIFGQIDEILDKVSIVCLAEKQETFLKELVKIYLNQIKIAWNKYEYNEIFWKHLFEKLKKNILLLAVVSNMNLSISDLLINFNSWQVNIINAILEIKDAKERKENLDKFIQFLKRWSDFLLDLARDTGLNNKQVGLSIIQALENNLRIIYGIKGKFPKLDLEKIYQTQTYILSWYFKDTDKIEDSFIFNLEEVQRILLSEISENLKDKIFNIDYLIELYIRLVEQHFNKVSLGHGYNHPRVVEKLIYLGLILHKHKRSKEEKIVISKIEELNNKYLQLNAEYFKLKQTTKNLMGPDEFQLCREISDLENDLFSYNSGPMMDIKHILKEEITKKEWDSFVKKIKYCKGIKYVTRPYIPGI